MDISSELAKLAAGRCWDGYEPVPGKGAYTDDSCRKIGGKKKKKQEKQAKSPAWQRKAGKNSKGGLNEKGRKSYERENPGSDLKAPVTGKVKPGGKAAKRRKSFCARMKGNKGPMKKPNGEPTRKALSLRKWKCGSDNQPDLKDDMIMEDQLLAELKEKLAASCGSHSAPKKKKKKKPYKAAAHCHCDEGVCPDCEDKQEKESALKGDQHKLDVDKDGKIESSDLKKLRGRGKNEKVALDELRLKLASHVIKHLNKESALKGDQHKLDVDNDGKIEGSDLKKLRGRGKTKKAVAAQLILEKVAADTSMTDMEKIAFLSATLKGLAGAARYGGRLLQGAGNMGRYMGKGLQQGVTSGGNLSRAASQPGILSRYAGKGMEMGGGLAQRAGQAMQGIRGPQMSTLDMARRAYQAASPVIGQAGAGLGRFGARQVQNSPIMQGLGAVPGMVRNALPYAGMAAAGYGGARMGSR